MSQHYKVNCLFISWGLQRAEILPCPATHHLEHPFTAPGAHYWLISGLQILMRSWMDPYSVPVRMGRFLTDPRPKWAVRRHWQVSSQNHFVNDWERETANWLSVSVTLLFPSISMIFCLTCTTDCLLLHLGTSSKFKHLYRSHLQKYKYWMQSCICVLHFWVFKFHFHVKPSRGPLAYLMLPLGTPGYLLSSS